MDALAPIHLIEHGRGPGPVWLLHGGPGAPGSVASLAEDLAPSFRVVEAHQRGSGEVPLTVQRHVADMAASITAPVVVVGWSWGAMLGLSFAAVHPERVRALVLVGCGTYDAASRAAYQAEMARRTGGAGPRLAAARLAARDPAERAAHLAAFAAQAERAQAHDPLDGPGPPMEGTLDLRAHEETWADALRLQAEGVEPRRFERIRAPVTMLHGAEDPHPGRATRDVLAAVIPGLAYVEFPDCGHKPWRERRARAPFLAELAARIAAAVEPVG